MPLLTLKEASCPVALHRLLVLLKFLVASLLVRPEKELIIDSSTLLTARDARGIGAAQHTELFPSPTCRIRLWLCRGTSTHNAREATSKRSKQSYS